VITEAMCSVCGYKVSGTLAAVNEIINKRKNTTKTAGLYIMMSS